MLTISIDEKNVYKIKSAAQAVMLAGFLGYMQALEDDDRIWHKYETAIQALITAVGKGELE